jgi:hypothetical protein
VFVSFLPFPARIDILPIREQLKFGSMWCLSIDDDVSGQSENSNTSVRLISSKSSISKKKVRFCQLFIIHYIWPYHPIQLSLFSKQIYTHRSHFFDDEREFFFSFRVSFREDVAIRFCF